MRTHAAPAALSEGIRREALELGFESVGLVPLRASDHEALYRDWIGRGLHGSMGYLARQDAVEARLDPRTRWHKLRSAVVVAHHYGDMGEAGDVGEVGVPGDSGIAMDDTGLPGEATSGLPGEATSGGAGEATSGDPGRGVIARYARGRDYHRVVKNKLLTLLRWIENETGRELPVARAYVDTGPVLERELAQRAGLGWQGRNTMLIDPRRGSYFFLGLLLLPFELDYDDPFTADRCGTCTACLDACPTGALLGRDENGAPIMDARLCISYLTIENRGPIPEALRRAIGNRVYGCDICQSVCPFNNERFVQVTSERDYRSDWRRAGDRPEAPECLPGTESPSLIELMRMTREEWDVWTRGSAIRRAGYAGAKRNVAVAMGNWLASVNEPPEAAVAALREALKDDEPLLREHAAWALEQAAR
jgi:epoxyqueuosine reductase